MSSLLKQKDEICTETLSQQIAMRLRAMRKEAGFKTGKSFAQKYGIPLTTYSQHETGKRKIAIEILIDYCFKLNANAGWVLTGTGEPWNKPQSTYVSAQQGTSQTTTTENIALLKQVFLAAHVFLDSSKLAFAAWVDCCLEIGATLSSQRTAPDQIDQIVQLVFRSKLGFIQIQK